MGSIAAVTSLSAAAGLLVLPGHDCENGQADRRQPSGQSLRLALVQLGSNGAAQSRIFKSAKREQDPSRRILAKHEVSFELAREVWSDPFYLVLPDCVEGGEQRWQASA